MDTRLRPGPVLPPGESVKVRVSTLHESGQSQTSTDRRFACSSAPTMLREQGSRRKQTSLPARCCPLVSQLKLGLVLNAT